MNSLFLYFYNKINFILDLLYFLFLEKKSYPIQPKTLLLVRLDAIGDYILFRNFIEIVFNSKKYRDYKITLCGNIEWKEIAEIHDKKFISQFIWIDRNKFGLNPVYRLKIANIINKKGFEAAIEPTYSREIHFGDFIIRASSALVRIGNSGELLKFQRWKRKFISDKYYTKIINLRHKNLFEFNRNKEFFEAMLGEKLDISRPHIEPTMSYSFKIQNKFIVVFIGGKQKKRKWSAKNYSSLINIIIKNINFDIVIVGSKYELKLAKRIESKIKNKSKLFNSTGQTSLEELIVIIHNSQLLVSNESMSIHIAAALNCKFVCISNGNHWGRFLPYPKEIHKKGIYIIPETLQQRIKYKGIDFPRYGSKININSINPKEVYEAVNNTLNNDI